MHRVLPSRSAAAAFAVAFATLVAQILFHRIISAKLINSYAFLVISLTMLGFAISGVLLSRSLARWLDRFDEMMVAWTALFVLSSIASTLIFYHAAIGSLSYASRGEFVLVLLRTLPYALLFAVPFVFSGLLLGALLSNPGLPTRKIYCWDLFGSACGALAVLPGITHWGVEKSLLGVCAILLLAILGLMRPLRKGCYGVAAAALLAVGACLAFEDPLLSFRYQGGSFVSGVAHPGSGMGLEEVRWDPVARIEVSRIPPPNPETMVFPSLVGSNPAFLGRFKRVLTQNNYAFTYAVDYDGNPASLDGIEETIYSAAYIASSIAHPKAAIIGVGGGFDVLTALHFNPSEVTGIEVNAATLGILRHDYADYFSAWTGDPRVRLVYDDGRHFLKGTSGRYDVIQLSGVDSYSGTPGAAYVFSESYLYTEEAFELYYSRLSADGILNVMRLEQAPPREMLRVLATAVGALRKAGVARVSEHIAMVSQKNGSFVALLVKKSPFTGPEEQRLARWTSTNRYLKLVVAPHLAPAGGISYQNFLAQSGPDAEEAYYDSLPYNVRPATDDQPFFFRFSRWSHLPFFFDHSPWANWPSMRHSVPVTELTLVVMLLLVGGVVLLCVWLPLRLMTKAATVPRRHGFIFAGIGLGYLAVEIALLQKFGLFLGHPNYALSVVLAGLLFATGIGALYSPTLSRWFRGPRFISYAFGLVVLGEALFVFPTLNKWVVGDFGLRVMVVLALVTPLGILMGTYVPSAVDQLKATAPEFVPWAWGINGVFSVLAPILSVAFSMTYGINALLLSTVPIYVVVGWLFPDGRARTASRLPGTPAGSGAPSS
jgi:spermidine synthase